MRDLKTVISFVGAIDDYFPCVSERDVENIY